jgi:uncharacterized membrane protein YgaE (UPF0421/DUF939 family)
MTNSPRSYMRLTAGFCIIMAILSFFNAKSRPDTFMGKFQFILAFIGLIVGAVSIAMSFRAKYK